MLATLAGSARHVQAQVAPPPDSDSPPGAPADPAADGSDGSSSAQLGEVKIEVEKFGVGKVARQGEWTGFRIRVLDTSSKPREVIVRLAGRDPDGDIPVSQREITTNPNTWQGLWLYQRLPFWFTRQELLSVSVYEANEVKGADGTTRFEAGSRLGQVRIAPQNMVEPGDDLIAIVGQRTAGLTNYTVRVPNGQYPAYSHEPIELIGLGAPSELPDRWLGLIQFPTIVWTAGDPADLRGDRAVALREWINRGGHLVIVLPTVGQTWTNSVNNELYDLLPAVTISRQESVDLAPYRSMITRSTTSRLPRNTVLHTFKPVKDANPEEAIEILSGPKPGTAGECMVVRRLIGAGAVTLVGFDLNNRELVDFAGIDADVFWNRVLGRRGEFPSPSEMNPLNRNLNLITSRAPLTVDADIQYQINHTATAGAGVLLGFLTFAAYWLLAGPVGFYLLKNYTKHQFSWLAFIGVGAIFTAISWTGAALLRPGKTEATHLTFLDHVYGQPTQRARSWMQVLIPHYGEATLSVGDANERNPRHAITAWEARSSDTGSSAFTDSQEYNSNWQSPNSITFPVRATIKQVQVDWAGGPRWKMPIPIHPRREDGSAPNIDEKPALKLADVGGKELLTGVLEHELPQALTDVRVILIRKQQDMNGRASDSLPASANIFALSAPWEPKTPLDLELVTSEVRGSLASEFIKGLLPPPMSNSAALGMGGAADEQPNQSGLLNRLLATALFPMLETPPKNQSLGSNLYAFRRTATHGYDLGMWFTQPCVIIIGQLGEGTGKGSAASPVPVLIDGEPLATRGRTVVRWVYPLASNPPQVGPPRPKEDVPAPAPDPQPVPPSEDPLKDLGGS